MDIATWEEAESLVREYAAAITRAERIEEALKAFAEARREKIGRKRELGPAVIGFERIAATVKTPSESLAWLARNYPELVVKRPMADKPSLRKFLKDAGLDIVSTFELRGIVYVSAYERFFLRLVHARRNTEEVASD